MNRLRILALFITLLCTWIHRASASNNYPIVLVHGVAGWGRDELAGFKYWGGFYGDYEKQLREEGFQVYSAAVGPFSSNWDRACELYAQIKGGRVDYGANHSATHGHARYGRTYPGFFPQWGQVIDGQVQKVHLIGHSLGGTTIRMLAQLLNRGTNGSSTEEEDVDSDALFAGGKDWIHSITTISSPNQGSLVADSIRNMIDLMEDTMTSIFVIAGGLGKATSEFYDAKLDQWSIRPKQAQESLKEYLHRVLSSRMFAPGFRDIAAYSLTTRGAQEENDWVHTLPHIYYYSFVTHDTFAWRDWFFRRIQLPNPFSMTAFLQPSSTLLGSRFTTFRGFDEQWQVNDGMVSLPSQTSDGRGQVVPYKDRSLRGVWNVFEPLSFVDHIGMMGLKLFHNVFPVYKTHATLLRNLPLDGGSSIEDNVIQNVLAQIQTDVTQAQMASSMAKCAQLRGVDDQKTFVLCEQFKQAYNTTK